MAAITSNGTGGGNWSATASWTGAAVPIEGDTVIIQNGDTITIDQNITVGADTTTAAIDVASGGKLEVLHTVAADYTLTCKGDLKTSSGGTIEFGTVANPIPSTRTFTVKLNYSAALAAGKYSLLNSGNMVLQGDPARITVTHCLLNADAAVNDNNLTTDVATGWKDNDDIAIASTSRTWTEAEDGQVNGDAVGVALTVDGFGGVGGGLAAAHQGTDNAAGDSCRAEIINLTRNVKVTSFNAGFKGYVLLDVGSTCDIDYVEFYELGMNAVDKYGFVCKTTAASTVHYNSFYNMYRGCSEVRYYCDNFTFDHNVIYNITHDGVYVYGDTVHTITNNIVIYAANWGFYFYFPQIDMRGNTAAACTYGIRIYTYRDIVNADDLTIHSCASYLSGYLYAAAHATYSNISNLKVWRNTGYFRFYDPCAGWTLTDAIFFGNGTNQFRIEGANAITFSNLRLYSEAAYTTANGINFIRGAADKIENSEIGTDGAHTSADIYFSSGYFSQLTLINTKLSSATEVSNFQNTIKGSYCEIEDLDQVQYADMGWYTYGKVVRDSTTVKIGTYSMRYDQYWAADDWLEYEIQVPVKSGEQIVVSAWLRKNASYSSANRPKIKISGMGITEDSDQMSDVTDTWERVTVSGIPTRTGLAMLTISVYLVNAGASAWADFQKTDVLSGVLNTIEGDFWANGHIAEVFMDTGSITAKEFWSTLTADVNGTDSFGALMKDYIDAAISSRATAAICTESRLAELDAGNIPNDLTNIWMASSTTFTRLTANRATYLDNLSEGPVALETTAQGIKAKTDTIDWANITSLIDEIGGKWEITGNQMIFYKSDNSTEIMRFNLFDSEGNPAIDDVYKRERV